MSAASCIIDERFYLREEALGWLIAMSFLDF